MDPSRPIRILYIEDDPGLARLVQKRLERVGYAVDIAADGEQGLAKYAADSYDVVFVDQSLPVYDGLQVIRILASRGPLPPMIMITGSGDEKVAVEAMKLGAGDYIVKDVEGGYLNLLPSVIEKALQQQRAVDEKQRAEEELQKERETFFSMLHKAPYGAMLIDKDGTNRYINPEFTKITGYTLKNIPTGRDWFRAAYPDKEYRQKAIGSWKRDFARKKADTLFSVVFSVVCKDGGVKEVEFRPNWLDDGQAIVMLADITERRQAEEALRESGDKLEKLHAVAGRLTACASEEEIYHVTVDAAKRILTFSFCSLGIVEGKHLVTKVADPHPFVDEIPPMPVNEGLTGTTYRNKKTHVVREIRKGVKALSPQSQYLSLVSAPIGDLGVFQAASIEPDAFTKDDTRLLEMLLGHTAAAIKRIRLQDELKEQAVHDPLTDLYNRYYLDKVLAHEVKRSKRYNHCIAFLMIDVNRFKEINDRYGHQIGDEILREVALLLRETVRESDIVVRYGGDEFLILLPETNGEVKIIKRRLADNVALRNKKNGRMDFPVTLSVGSASWDPKDHKSVDEVLNEADRRMYEDKKRHNGHVKGANYA